ncbi:hypothetical protein BCR34DRAFT_592460 [Clohesyomyces aquaticus]|uniref:Uncharacterized protein n=1 Tax=Clohesyomyces aquaticus TaxID=1231657 RepID=A0A1Y1YRS7_9PLEO|nr:hypothetical protein BCR34DRAFT_592460 [Clohesyomyces aquaticus]
MSHAQHPPPPSPAVSTNSIAPPSSPGAMLNSDSDTDEVTTRNETQQTMTEAEEYLSSSYESLPGNPWKDTDNDETPILIPAQSPLPLEEDEGGEEKKKGKEKEKRSTIIPPRAAAPAEPESNWVLRVAFTATIIVCLFYAVLLARFLDAKYPLPNGPKAQWTATATATVTEECTKDSVKTSTVTNVEKWVLPTPGVQEYMQDVVDQKMQSVDQKMPSIDQRMQSINQTTHPDGTQTDITSTVRHMVTTTHFYTATITTKQPRVQIQVGGYGSENVWIARRICMI